MITQNMLRTNKRKIGLFEWNKSDVWLRSVFHQILQTDPITGRLLLTCAPIPELPSNISTMRQYGQIRLLFPPRAFSLCLVDCQPFHCMLQLPYSHARCTVYPLSLVRFYWQWVYYCIFTKIFITLVANYSVSISTVVQVALSNCISKI